MLHASVICSALAVLTAQVPAPQAKIREAVEKALPLLAKGATGHAEQKTCFACHNQAFPMAAFAAARSRGFEVSEDLFHDQAEHIREFIDRNREAYTTGKGTGGQVDTAGWLLFTLERAGERKSESTAAVVEYLLKRDADRGFWRTTSDRPPSEASSFTVNYLAVRGLNTWSSDNDQERAAKRIQAVRDWLIKTPAKDTEDQVFRLRALKEVKADPKTIREEAQRLIQNQRFDGGWGQLPQMPSDSYATGSVLVALHEAADESTTSPVFQRGTAFLVRTQKGDGSWYVKSRSKPFQPYYESGYPHKKDQFISIAAGGWATTALALACKVK